MTTRLLWIIAAAVLLVAFLVYRFRSTNELNVTPEAAEEIEKAKRR